MRLFTSFLIIVTLVLGIFTGCGEPMSETSDTVATPTANPTANPDVKTGLTGSFDTDFIGYIASSTDKSFVVSPISFKYALAMLAAGTGGSTQTELLNALMYRDTATLNNDLQSFGRFVDEYEDYFDRFGIKGPALQVANSIWKRGDLPAFNQGFTDVMSLYSAEYYDFSYDSVIRKVNDWVNEKTHQMIPQLLPDNYDSRNLSVILMNALYFKDIWNDDFSDIGQMDFTCRSGAKVSRNFFGRTEDFRYYRDDDTELVVLPMSGGVSFVAVLGSTENIRSKISAAESAYVDVRLPEFETECSMNNGELKSFLAERGVTSVFDPTSADLAPMIDYPDLYVDDIIQKAKIKLDKTGVEAAAVTAIMVKAGAMPIDRGEPIVFTADREFSYFIMADTGDIMFAGRVSE